MMNQKMEMAVRTQETGLYRNILVALDSSDHANRGIVEAVALAALCDGRITGTHVYAAKMHDTRFRQMEGGLPEQFREEQELERQREVHDDLISRGLSIITDSYLDQAEKRCSAEGIELSRCSLEGKNYRSLVNEANCGDHDLLIMGALGLGGVAGDRLGSVCTRVVRRSDIDTLVIKDPLRPISDGPIAVAVDGSARSYGGLRTALLLAKSWGVPVQVLAAFDPYYHYVAFNRIAGVLSEEASKVFRFKDQEKLHEEIIDSGLAKIYEGHLAVAESIAEEYGQVVETILLDGKPYDAIRKHLDKFKPSLLVLGKLGIHADPDLDIGGNAEALLRNVDCAVLLSQRQHQPRVDVVADVTTSWTTEAEQRMQSVPSFAQGMVRMAILRFAQERGHTVVTASIVDEATAELCPAHARNAMAEIVAAHDAGELGNGQAAMEEMEWTDTARQLLQSVTDVSLQDSIRRRSEKKARRERENTVDVEHVDAFLPGHSDDTESGQAQSGAADTLPRLAIAIDGVDLHWNAEALARLMRVPEGFMRDACKARIEAYAYEHGHTDITIRVAEHGLEQARHNMQQAVERQSPGLSGGGCPFGHDAGTETSSSDDYQLSWDSAAEQRLAQIPEGYMRVLTRQRVEAYARNRGVTVVTRELMEEKYAEWAAGSAKQNAQLHWDDSAWRRVRQIPDFVRGMVIKEIENCARQLGVNSVTTDVMAHARDAWSDQGVFHSEAAPQLYEPGGAQVE